MSAEYVLTLSCPDRVGIVFEVAGFLAARRCNILDSQQYGDPYTQRFFMRLHFRAEPPAVPGAVLSSEFADVAQRFAMHWQLHDTAHRPAVLIMVSQFGHCLNDLLYRWRVGALRCRIAGVVSNHRDFAGLAATYDLPYHYLPVAPDPRSEQEGQVLELVRQLDVELVVLARYMQVLSDEVCKHLAGRIINIHHSFLPSFKGARPYQQAHARGVKVIGATAHYVTPELDEGPIIEQEVARVDHTYDPEALAAAGRDVESLALARAVRWHVEHRVLLDGHKTIVFR